MSRRRRAAHEVKPSMCPSCGLHLNAAMMAQGPDAAPKAGDVGVCAGCGEIMLHQAPGHSPRRATPTDIAAMWAEDRVMALDVMSMALAIRAKPLQRPGRGNGHA